MTMKKCTSCEVEFPATSEFFNNRKQSKDGFEYKCRTCGKDRTNRKSAKSVRLEAEKIAGVRECDMCHELKPFPEFYKQKGGKRFSTIRNCKECHKRYQREQRVRNNSSDVEYHSIRENLNGARKRAKKYGYPFDIVIEDLMPFPTHCEIFDIELTYGENNKHSGASLDKVIPSLGYVKGNVKIISSRANNMKGDSTLDDLKNMIQYIEVYS